MYSESFFAILYITILISFLKTNFEIKLLGKEKIKTNFVNHKNK